MRPKSFASLLSWVVGLVLLGTIAIFVTGRLTSSHRQQARPNERPSRVAVSPPVSPPKNNTGAASPAASAPVSEPRHAVPERESIASGWKEESIPALAEFAEWTQKYLSATVNERAALTQQGIELAKVRREVFGNLIESDPRRALAAAIP